jgi:hypothetical protein
VEDSAAGGVLTQRSSRARARGEKRQGWRQYTVLPSTPKLPDPGCYSPVMEQAGTQRSASSEPVSLEGRRARWLNLQHPLDRYNGQIVMPHKCSQNADHVVADLKKGARQQLLIGKSAVKHDGKKAQGTVRSALAAFSAKIRKSFAEKGLTLEEAFKFFDTAGEGVITKQELVSGLKEMDISVSAALLGTMWPLFDRNSDGTISKLEFAELMVNKNSVSIMQRKALRVDASHESEGIFHQRIQAVRWETQGSEKEQRLYMEAHEIAQQGTCTPYPKLVIGRVDFDKSEDGDYLKVEVWDEGLVKDNFPNHAPRPRSAVTNAMWV